MKIVIYKNNIDNRFNELDISYKKIKLNNNEIKDIIEINELVSKFNIKVLDLLENILKNFYQLYRTSKIIDNNIILIEVDNYNLVYYLKSTYPKNDILIDNNELNIEKLFYNMINKNTQKSHSLIIERNQILNDTEDGRNILEKILNLDIDNTYCITIKERKDRQKSVSVQCSQLGLSFDFVKVEKNKENPEKGCLESHILCIKDAKLNGYKNVLIMEDDVKFNGSLLRLYLNELKIKVPEDFDIFYLGYNVNDGYKYDNNIMKICSSQCAHCYIVNEKIYDYILENIEKDWTTFPIWSKRNNFEKQVNFNCRAVDLFYGKLVSNLDNSYGLYPMLCHQLDSFSDIENRVVSYTNMLNKKSLIMYGNFKYDFNTFFINLDKRKDRLNNFNQKYGKFISKYQRFPAIDGSTHELTEKEEELFDLTNFPNNIKNPYHSHGFKAGIIGCGLSHFQLWEIISNHQGFKEDDFVLILEDDIELCDDFIIKFNNLLDNLVNDKEWDINYLGFTDYKDHNDIKINDKNLIKFSGVRRLNGGGTFGYIIRKKGAQRLIEIAKKNKIQQAIDWFMIEQFDKIVCYKCEPELIFSKVQNNIKGGDSDVQNMPQKIKFKKNDEELGLPSMGLEDIPEDDPLNEPEPIIEKKEEEKIDNNFLEVLINNDTYFKNSSNKLFKIIDDILYFYGYIENNKIIESNIARHKINHQIKKTFNKEHILFYIDEKLPYYLRKYIETFSNKYNVIIIGKELYNIKINNVIYIHKHKDNLLNNIINSFQIKKIIITNFDYFLYTEKKEDQEVFYLHNTINFFPTYKNKKLKNNGISLTKNFMHNIDKLLFFSNDELQYFKKFLNINNIDNSLLISYNIPKNEKNIDLRSKKNLITCYDKHPGQITRFFEQFKKSFKNDFKLVIFNNDIQLPSSYIIVEKRNEINLAKYLKISKIFMTFETLDNTYFNILTAINYNCLCLIPKYYKEISNKTIAFDIFNNENFKTLINILNNQTKMKIYNIIFPKIIESHMKNKNIDLFKN
jgi:GR25 family glycosyltransferase involved in LPS biosynthesis